MSAAGVSLAAAVVCQWWGRLHPTVLYCALEDDERRQEPHFETARSYGRALASSANAADGMGQARQRRR